MIRRYTFKIYPTPTQAVVLREQARLCAILWNALLEMRETRYRRAKQRGDKKTSLTAYDQGKELTKLNQATKTDPQLAEWRLLSSKLKERVAGDLDLAFKAFFRRAKGGAGARSGYPRYKSTRHADSIPLREMTGGGWKFSAHSAPARNGEGRTRKVYDEDRESCSRSMWRLILFGVPGAIKARGRFPVEPKAIKTADVKFHDGAWWFSVAVEIERARAHGQETLEVAFDLIDQFAVVKTANGGCPAGLSDPFSNGRKGESRRKVNAETEVPCGTPPNGGEAQDVATRYRRRSPCGTPPNGGEAQDACSSASPLSPCGTPPNGGEAQVFRLSGRSSLPCGTPPNGGEAHVLPPAIAQNVDAIQSAGDRKYVRGSIRWRRERQRVARIKAKEARRTKEALHRWTTDIVAHASELHIIAPPIQDNTKSGRGDAERNGAEVKTIAALNRRILSMAPASAVQMLDYKAKEAGVACLVERSDNHQISVGGDLRAAAIDARLAKRAIKRRERIMEAAE